MVSTFGMSSAMPSSATLMRWVPSKPKGLVTTAMVSAPVALAVAGHNGRGAGAGAAAHAGGDKDHIGAFDDPA